MKNLTADQMLTIVKDCFKDALKSYLDKKSHFNGKESEKQYFTEVKAYEVVLRNFGITTQGILIMTAEVRQSLGLELTNDMRQAVALSKGELSKILKGLKKKH